MKKLVFSLFLLVICFSFTFAQRDINFGNNGIVTTSFPPVSSKGEKILVLPDEKILLAGRTFGNSNYSEAVLAKYDKGGNLDTSFSFDGKFILPNFESVISIISIDLKPDGKFLLSAKYQTTTTNQNTLIAQITSDGELDTTFGNNGILIIDRDNYDDIRELEVQADGKFYIAGTNYATTTGVPNGFVSRYTSNGQLDTTFANGLFQISHPNNTDYRFTTFTTVKVLNNNEIFIGGYRNILSDDVIIMAKVDANGNFRNDFGVNGIKTSLSAATSFYSYFKYAILPSGKIVVLRRNGLELFSSNGSFEMRRTYSFLSSTFDVSLTNTGNIVVQDTFANYLTLFNPLFKPLGILRFPTNSGGINDYYNSYAIQNDNKILLTGYSYANSIGNILVTRFIRFTVFGSNNLGPDYDGDGKSDFGVCRTIPNTPAPCFILKSNGTGNTLGIGNAPYYIPEDYDGDGKADLASSGNAFTPPRNNFVVWSSENSNTTLQSQQWGLVSDISLGGDYDGDGKTDFTVYRSGTWYVLKSSDNTALTMPWGLASDKPVPADYDNDGKTDFAIYRPNGGIWAILRSTDSGATILPFGISEDKPVPADYDGDGKADIAVYRPSNGFWYSLKTTSGFEAIPFGISTDRPVPADYDGDGKADIAVFRAGDWYYLGTTSGFQAVHWGQSGDIPLTTAYSAY